MTTDEKDFVIDDGKLTKYKGSGSNIVIPNGVKEIAGYTFHNRTGLTSVTIPNGVKRIGEYAFSGCTGLTSVTIPNGVKRIDGHAFEDCTELTSVTIPNSVYAVSGIGPSAFSGCAGLTSITIPDSVKKISDYAFSNCTGLTSVTIPDGLREISDYAFSNCTGLTSVNIPDSIEKIGSFSFENCTGLTSVTIPSNVNKVSKIGFSAFRGCTGLTSVTLPDSLREISDRAFSNCAGLTSVNIPDSVEKIGFSSFEDCTGLTSVTIPDSVKEISYNAFFRCTGLTSVIIPESVKKICRGAFAFCDALTSITILGNPVLEENSISHNSYNLTIYAIMDSFAEEYAQRNGLHFEGINTANILSSLIAEAKKQNRPTEDLKDVQGLVGALDFMYNQICGEDDTVNMYVILTNEKKLGNLRRKPDDFFKIYQDSFAALSKFEIIQLRKNILSEMKDKSLCSNYSENFKQRSVEERFLISTGNLFIASKNPENDEKAEWAIENSKEWYTPDEYAEVRCLMDKRLADLRKSSSYMYVILTNEKKLSQLNRNPDDFYEDYKGSFAALPKFEIIQLRKDVLFEMEDESLCSNYSESFKQHSVEDRFLVSTKNLFDVVSKDVGKNFEFGKQAEWAIENSKEWYTPDEYAEVRCLMDKVLAAIRKDLDDQMEPVNEVFTEFSTSKDMLHIAIADKAADDSDMKPNCSKFQVVIDSQLVSVKLINEMAMTIMNCFTWYWDVTIRDIWEAARKNDIEDEREYAYISDDSDQFADQAMDQIRAAYPVNTSNIADDLAAQLAETENQQFSEEYMENMQKLEDTVNDLGKQLEEGKTNLHNYSNYLEQKKAKDKAIEEERARRKAEAIAAGKSEKDTVNMYVILTNEKKLGQFDRDPDDFAEIYEDDFAALSKSEIIQMRKDILSEMEDESLCSYYSESFKQRSVEDRFLISTRNLFNGSTDPEVGKNAEWAIESSKEWYTPDEHAEVRRLMDKELANIRKTLDDQLKPINKNFAEFSTARDLLQITITDKAADDSDMPPNYSNFQVVIDSQLISVKVSTNGPICISTTVMNCFSWYWGVTVRDIWEAARKNELSDERENAYNSDRLADLAMKQIRAAHPAITSSNTPGRKEQKKDAKAASSRQKKPAKKEGCYIATAVYGSYDAPEVITLRRFRDETLRNTAFGRWFIRTYYRLSPPVAEKLKDAKHINALVRSVLDKWVEKLNRRQG